MKMKSILILILMTAGCAHGIRRVEDCGQVQAVDRKVECGACTLQNKAGGALGTYEYKQDGPDGQRCVRVE